MTLFYGVFYGTMVDGDFNSLILIAICGKNRVAKINRTTLFLITCIVLSLPMLTD